MTDDVFPAGKPREKDNSKYLQCILPFICLLQVMSVVSVCVCFYMYKVTSDDYDSLARDFRLLRMEMENNISAKILEVQQLSKNISVAKKSLYEYEDSSYDNYDTDDVEDVGDTAPPPPLPIGPASEEQNNYHPNVGSKVTPKSQQVEDFNIPDHNTDATKEDRVPLDTNTTRQKPATDTTEENTSRYRRQTADADGGKRDAKSPAKHNEDDSPRKKKRKAIHNSIPDLSNILNSAHNFSNEDDTFSKLTIGDLSMEVPTSKHAYPKAKSRLYSLPRQSLMSHTCAIHMGGDTSNHAPGNHKGANGHLKHPRGKMEGWKINPKIPMDEENFNLRADGTLQVKQPGLYFVYAQIFYTNNSTQEDVSIISGFDILLNGTPTMKCVSTGLPPRSCYTGGLVSMVGNDELSVNEVILGRWTVFEPTRSFFGAFKIG
ncbi:hypothetical protein M8J77_008264 [Diaphorina citri]|nr:hypothetical protein M8J77_008264 [Diaphorina citri]